MIPALLSLSLPKWFTACLGNLPPLFQVTMSLVWHPPRKLWNRKVLSISILSTCGQIYTETIDILYSENAFTARNGDVIVRLASTIPLVYSNRTRSLRLICHVTSAPPIPFNQAAFEHPAFMNWYTADRQGESLTIQPQWTSIWNIPTNMSSLRYLDVKLRMLDRASCAKFNAGRVETLLEPKTQPNRGFLFKEFRCPERRRVERTHLCGFRGQKKRGWEGDEAWDQAGCEIRRPLWE